MPQWKLWYSDGSSYSDDDGPPEGAPAFDVQVIMQRDPQSGRYAQCLNDFYTWRDGRWIGVDYVGMIDYLAHFAPCVVRFGRTVDNFYDILRLAEADPDFPERSAWHKGELRP